MTDALTAWQTANGQIAIADSQVDTLKEAVNRFELCYSVMLWLFLIA